MKGRVHAAGSPMAESGLCGEPIPAGDVIHVMGDGNAGPRVTCPACLRVGREAPLPDGELVHYGHRGDERTACGRPLSAPGMSERTQLAVEALTCALCLDAVRSKAAHDAVSHARLTTMRDCCRWVCAACATDGRPPRLKRPNDDRSPWVHDLAGGAGDGGKRWTYCGAEEIWGHVLADFGVSEVRLE